MLINPQIESLKETITRAVSEHDFKLAAFFLLINIPIEALLLVWGLPKFLDYLADRKFIPARRIAADRIADSIRELFRVNRSLDVGISAAITIMKGDRKVEDLASVITNFNRILDNTVKRLPPGTPFSAPPSLSAPPPPVVPQTLHASNEPTVDARSKRIENLLITRDVDELLEAIDDTERTM